MKLEKDQQGKGYGSMMIKFLQDKYKDIWLEPRNASHNFYLKLGAKPFGNYSNGWLFALNNKLPFENWKLFVGDNVDFCRKPDDDFVYKPEDWNMNILSMLP